MVWLSTLYDCTFILGNFMCEACEDITKVIPSAMETYFPHTYKLWFTNPIWFANVKSNPQNLPTDLTNEALITTNLLQKLRRTLRSTMLVGHFGYSPSTWTTTSMTAPYTISQLMITEPSVISKLFQLSYDMECFLMVGGMHEFALMSAIRNDLEKNINSEIIKYVDHMILIWDRQNTVFAGIV